MHRKIFIVILLSVVISTFFLLPQTAYGEINPSSEKFVSFSDPSYITYKGGIGNIEKLIYEACISPSFIIDFNKFPDWGIELTPRIVLRMLDQYSHPIRTPSYMPMGTLFYHAQKMSDYKRDMFAFLTFGHHSNGQDGLLTLSDNVTINTYNGSFANNYLKGGFIFSYPEKKIFTPFSNLKFAASIYRVRPPLLKSMYGYIRLYGDMESVLNISRERGNIFNSSKT